MSDLLLQALVNRQRDANNNPWIQAGNTVQQFVNPIATDPNSSSKDKLLGAVMAGIGGGLVSGMGRRQAQNEVADFSRNLNNLNRTVLSGGDISPYINGGDRDLAFLAPILQTQQDTQQQQMQQEFALKQAEWETKGDIDLRNAKERARYQHGLQRNLADYRNSLANQVNNVPGIPEKYQGIAAKVMSDIDLSPEETNVLVTAPMDVLREIRQNKQINEVSNRFNTNLGVKDGEIVVPGYQQMTNFRLRPGESEKIREKNRRYDSLARIFEKVASDPNVNPDSYMGQEGALTDALRQIAFGDLRSLAEAGANLTETEVPLITDQLFKTLNTDPIGSMKAMARGIDQREFAKNMANIFRKARRAELATNFGLVENNTNPEDYSEFVRNRLSPQLNQDGQSFFSRPPVAQAAGGQTKVVNGVTLKKVPGGWQRQ